MSEEGKPVVKKIVVKKVVKVSNLPSESKMDKPNSSLEKKNIPNSNLSESKKSVAKPSEKSELDAKFDKIVKEPKIYSEHESTKLVIKPVVEPNKKTIAQNKIKEMSKTIRTNEAKTSKKFSKKTLILVASGILGIIAFGVFYVAKSNPKSENIPSGSNDDSGAFGLPKLNNLLSASSANLSLPVVARLPAGAPLWVHLVNSAGDAEALKNGPAKALNAYKELKENSPFVILTPTPPKGGWLAPDKIKELAIEVQATIKNQKCDASRLVISGEGVGTTAALLLAGELNGAVGAVLGIGAPTEEMYAEVERFRYVPIRLLAPAADKDAVGWTQKIAGDLRASGCAVSVTEISPSPNLIGGAWGAPELWAWMVTRRVADANTRAGIDSLLAWSPPKPPPGITLSAKSTVVDEALLVKGALFGEYFDGVAFNKKILDRLDKSIEIPDRNYQLPENKADNVSVRWSGLIRIEKEGVYTFYSISDDGQRLSVGGVAVIDDWADHGATEKSGAIKLSVGWYHLVVEHYQGGGGGSITASWQGPGFERKVIGGDVVAILKPKQGKQ